MKPHPARLADARVAAVDAAYRLDPMLWTAAVYVWMAEREGFEPSVPRKEDNGFRDRPVRPLRHLSHKRRPALITGLPANETRNRHPIDPRQGRGVIAAIADAAVLSVSAKRGA